MKPFPHSLYLPVSAYMSKGKPSGKRMRIGGLVSTDRVDLDGEKILQDGLDFTYFMKHGWFNDDHKKGQTEGAVVGYPDTIKYLKKGQKMPNGKIASRNGWYVEGYLTDTEKGRQLFELASSLAGTGRSLGFSVEGKISDRSGGNLVGHTADGKRVVRGGTIRKAHITNIAITHKPVNTDTYLEVLAKSLTAGHGDPTGAVGTAGDGSPLRRESLEGAPKKLEGDDMKGKDELVDLIDELESESVEVAKSLESDEELVKAVNVTPFLRSLVDQTTIALAEVGEELSKSQRLGIAQAKLVKALIDRVEERDELIKAQSERIDALSDQLSHLGNSPVLRKGIVNQVEAKIADRQIRTTNGATADDLKSMTKGQILDVMEKSLAAATDKSTENMLEKAIIQLEGRNFVDPRVIPHLTLS
jgi:hypothetical protein